MRSLSLPGISSYSTANLSQLQPAQTDLNRQSKTVRFSGLPTDVFESHIQKAKPALQAPRFGAWPSPQKWNVNRAKEVKKKTNSGSSANFLKMGQGLHAA